MQYTVLGSTGVQVSKLCFGTMSFGGDADQSTSAAMFAACRDAGINFFDCANVYNEGRAEEILGRLIQGQRDELIITSKVFGAMSNDRNHRGLSRRHITRAVEESLRRLGTDRLDLYFVHQWDEQTPMEETLAALDDLVHSGKIVYPAVSNWTAWQIAKSLGKCELNGWSRFACVQPMYSLAKRQAEVEILPLAQSENLGVIPYSPLGGGLLSGKYSTQNRPEGGRLQDNKMYTKRYGDPKYFETAERFTQYAQEQNIHPATLAVAWVKSHPAITAPIIGARNVEQLQPSLQAGIYEMTPEQRAEISALSPTPPPATDRSENQ
jgi:aryl-alcohol dehydrogenase-like predicted oxidoreductase